MTGLVSSDGRLHSTLIDEEFECVVVSSGGFGGSTAMAAGVGAGRGQ